MPLALYRRHRLNCEASQRHPEDSLSYEADEKRKGYKGRCCCEIHVAGTLSGKRIRKTTGKTTWDDARAVADAIDAEHTNRVIAAPAPAPPEPDPPRRITISDAIKIYLATRGPSVVSSTHRKYKTYTSRLQKFGDAKGYVFLEQFRPADIDLYFTQSPLGPRSKAKMLDWLRSFWRFAAHREWVAKSPVSPDLKPPAGSTRAANKMPFTDEQLADIIEACDEINAYKKDGRWGNRFGSGEWNGDDVKDFVWLMTYTGLRISDVVLFDMQRLHGSEVFLRAKKNGGDVFTVIPDWLRDRLLARAKRCGNQPFMVGGSKRLDTVTDAWRQRLAKVFELVDIGAEKATPHRFRHTFARILLQKGVSAADVADLMGDDEKTIKTHYAFWVTEKQARLSAILRDAFSDKPKLAVVPGGRS